MKNALFAGTMSATLAASASAEIAGVVSVSSFKTVSDFSGSAVTVGVTDLYAISNDAADTLLSVSEFNLINTATPNYYQSSTGVGWLPTNLGGPFDSQATREADSFVTIGGFDTTAEQAPGAGAGISLDANFGGNTAPAPGIDAGWFTANPGLASGLVGDTPVGLGVLIGRFSALGTLPVLNGTTLSLTWNQGLGTASSQASFVVFFPAPGGLALMTLAGFKERRRRG